MHYWDVKRVSKRNCTTANMLWHRLVSVHESVLSLNALHYLGSGYARKVLNIRQAVVIKYYSVCHVYHDIMYINLLILRLTVHSRHWSFVYLLSHNKPLWNKVSIKCQSRTSCLRFFFHVSAFLLEFMFWKAAKRRQEKEKKNMWLLEYLQ